MKKKILYIENEAYTQSVSFYKAALEASKRMGWEFHLAFNCLNYSEEGIHEIEDELGLFFHQIDFVRNPIHLGNIRAYFQLKKLIDESFDIIHCNTPVGGVLGRLVAAKEKIHPVIYQAHGFHFYSGAPLINWLMYYPAEKGLARFTDKILTINKDDYEFARRHLHPKSGIYYVHGVGLELNLWEDGHNIRKELGINENDFVILSVGRLEKNKNCGVLIDAVNKTKDTKIVFCGDGEDRELLQEKALRSGIAERVLFLGNRKDMSNIYHSADCFVLASYREGLSRSIMEAMACGLPCVVSDIRGNRDLIDSKGGFLFNPDDADALAESINKIHDSKVLQKQMSIHNSEKVKLFSFDTVVKEIISIYQEINEQKNSKE